MKHLRTFDLLKTFEVKTEIRTFFCKGVSAEKISWYFEDKNIIEIIERPEIDLKPFCLIVL